MPVFPTSTRFASRMLALAAAVGALAATVSLADAQVRGVQITPNASRVLVNKDFGAERWAISRNEDDGSVTGNVFRTDGSPPAFLSCEPVGATGAVRCFGADSCAGQGGRRGIQRTPDGKRILANKDVGAERWAISLNEDGTVTGNVFRTDGSPPVFLYCEPTGTGALDCSGADACQQAPCSGSFNFIATITLPADFFAPPEPCGTSFNFIAEVTLPQDFFSVPDATRTNTEQLRNDAQRTTEEIVDIGVGILGPAQARLAAGVMPAAVGVPCAFGGFYVDAGDGSVEFFDCILRSGIALRGVVFSEFDVFSGILILSTNELLLHDLRTGRDTFLAGQLGFRESGGFTELAGVLAILDSSFGRYDLSYEDVVVDDFGNQYSGEYFIEVFDGRGILFGVHLIFYEVVAIEVQRLLVEFDDGSSVTFVFAPTLCNACTSDAFCADHLGCFVCESQCTGVPGRCSFPDEFITCVDGVY